MTKLWISPSLEIRHSLTGWPKNEDYVTVCDGGQHGHYDYALYEADLAKAKEESILVEKIPHSIFDSDQKPDSFVEFDGEVKVFEQWRHTGVGGIGWRDGTENTCWQMANAGYDTRKIARLKPVNSAHGFSEGSDAGVGQYYDKAHGEDKQREYMISELEKLGPMVIGTGLKARILEAFKARFHHFNGREDIILSEVLDELGIK